jgi:hypothetical protein
MKNTIWTPQFSEILFKESDDATTKGIKAYGVVMPQNVVSRNNVLYDWNSVRAIHKNLINKPFMIQHEVDGIGAVSIGHITDTNILDLNGIRANPKYNIIASVVESYNLPANTEFWVYEADLNPNKKDYIDEIRRGDMRHVSIQLKADDTKEEIDGNGDTYTVAKPTDLIEMSGVYTPGFLQTCAVLAEKYGGNKMNSITTSGTSTIVNEKVRFKSDVTTGTGAGAIAPSQPLEKEEEKDFKDSAITKCDLCGHSSFNHVNGGFYQCQKCKSINTFASKVESKESIPADLPLDAQKQDPQQSLDDNFQLLADEILGEIGEKEVMKLVEMDKEKTPEETSDNKYLARDKLAQQLYKLNYDELDKKRRYEVDDKLGFERL